MMNTTTPADVCVLSKFSTWKVLGISGFLAGAAALMWFWLLNFGEYQGRRYPPEVAKVLLTISTIGITAFLPLCVWHVWNYVRRPAALYVSGGRLFIYWAYFQSIAIKDIEKAVDLGRSGPMRDSVRLSVNGPKVIVFQTGFMADSGSDVVAKINRALDASA